MKPRARTPSSAVTTTVRRAAVAVGERSRAAGNAVQSGIRRVRKQTVQARRRLDRTLTRATGIEIEWCRAFSTASGATGLIAGRGRIRSSAALLLHPNEGCHLKIFDEINKYIDDGGGWAQRLGRGHSAEWLVHLVRKFGLKAVPAYTIHLVQDSATIHGIPLFPFAGHAYRWLLRRGLRPGVALRLVSVNLAKVAAGVGVALTAYELWQLSREIYRQIQKNRCASAA